MSRVSKRQLAEYVKDTNDLLEYYGCTDHLFLTGRYGYTVIERHDHAGGIRNDTDQNFIVGTKGECAEMLGVFRRGFVMGIRTSGRMD